MRDELIRTIAKVVCALSLSVFASLLLIARYSATVRPGTANVYQVGQRVDVGEAMFANSPNTLLIFHREGCPASQAFSPIALELIRLARSKGAGVKVLMPSGDTSQVAKNWGLQDGEVVIPEESPRVLVVPTVLVVSDTGTILYSQEGRPETPSDEERMREAIFTLF